MSNPKRQDSFGNGNIGDPDHRDEANFGEDGLEKSSPSAAVRSDDPMRLENADGGLTERLTGIFVGEGDGDLLLQQNDGGFMALQWLQALDLQVMGACRADERLKPLLKLNASGAAAEDRLLAHLSQHFEASEVGMLARCLCVPLVSIRVGKIEKQGGLLCPTTARGNLNLTLLPASDLRISFIGDDGCSERLITLRSIDLCSPVTIEEIPADNSGRSFLLKASDGEVFYFWCSEKSKLLGNELLSKMKDLLQKKPSLAELTGISEARLNCFASHLRAYLVGSTVSGNNQARSGPFPPSDLGLNEQLVPTTAKPSRYRHTGSLAVKASSPYQGSLSPRSSSFKEGLPRSLSSLRTAAREKNRRRGDSHLPTVENYPILSSVTKDVSSSCNFEKDRAPEGAGTSPLSPSNLLESLGESAIPSFMSPGSLGASSSLPLFPPYYCWCPPCVSTLQYTVVPPLLPSSSEPLSHPPLTPLLPASRSSGLLAPMPPFELSNIPSINFPAIFPEPLVQLSSAQQIATFTPLMCDPIVHIPVIDVCSSGQGYLVSAGATMATAIPPLHPNIMNSLGPETDPMVEKGARETLRLLLSGSNAVSPQLDVIPAVRTRAEEKQSMFVTGSRGFYSGVNDVCALANSFAAMGLASLSGRSAGEDSMKRCSSHEIIENPVVPGSEDEGSVFPDSSKN